MWRVKRERERESIESIFDCSYSLQIWDIFHSVMHIPNVVFQSIFDRMDYYWNVTCKSNLRASLLTNLPMIICWELWKGRNKKIYENESIIPQILWRFIVNQSHLLYSAHSTIPGDCTDYIYVLQGLIPNFRRKTRPRLTIIRWSPPDVGLKINCDAAFRYDFAGLGCVIRNVTGSLIHIISRPCPASSILEAELLSIFVGVQWAATQNVPCIIETDCLAAYRILEQMDKQPWHVTVLMRNIRSITQGTSVSFSHIHREGNQVADYLAKTALKSRSETSMEDIYNSPELSFLIRRDKLFPHFRYSHVDH